jgi:hypothetical protein
MRVSNKISRISKIIPVLVFAVLAYDKVYSQNGDTLAIADTTVDLTINISTKFPSNTVFPTRDSIIFIYLYQDGLITGDPLKKEYIYNEAESLITAKFDGLLPGQYSLKIAFERYNINQLTRHLHLYSDSTINLVIQPRKLYEVEARADPREFEIYLGYVRKGRPDEIQYSKYESDVFTGVVRFSVMGGSARKWRVKIRRIDEPDTTGIEISKKFSELSFRRENPFTKDDMDDFNWLKLEKVK